MSTQPGTHKPAHTSKPHPLINTIGLNKTYPLPSDRLFQQARTSNALVDVNLRVEHGESVAIVGESGSGKTTLIRLLLGLTRQSSGEIRFDGRLVNPKKDQLLWLRKRSGIVFQDPYSSLNPRRTIGQTVQEPLEASSPQLTKNDRDHAVREILTRMSLPPDTADRYPAELSGGERQRVAIARALIHRPDLLIGDEPVSALDVLVRQRLLTLLAELRNELGLTMITVTHDLSIVPQLAERIIVMRQGTIIETGPTDTILTNPREPYTRRLVSAIPRLPRKT